MKLFCQQVIVKMFQNDKGISLLEIIIASVIILIFTVRIIPWQICSWKRTSGYTRMVTACRTIERQVEQCRIRIGTNPDVEYTYFKNCTDTIIWDSTVTPPIACNWHVETALDIFGDTLDNVRRVTIVAHWSEVDSLVVKTAIAKNF